MGQTTLPHHPRPTLSTPYIRSLVWGGGSRANVRGGECCSGGGGVECLSRPRYRPPTPMVIEEIPFKCSTCKTSAGVIKEIPYEMEQVQD